MEHRAAFDGRNYSVNYLLYYNNTVRAAIGHGPWAAAQLSDAYGCRAFNNLSAGKQGHLKHGFRTGNNIWGYRQLAKDWVPPAGSKAVDGGVVLEGITDGFQGAAPDCGAYELGGEMWKPGHDFDNPPADIDTKTVTARASQSADQSRVLPGRYHLLNRKGSARPGDHRHAQPVDRGGTNHAGRVQC